MTSPTQISAACPAHPDLSRKALVDFARASQPHRFSVYVHQHSAESSYIQQGTGNHLPQVKMHSMFTVAGHGFLRTINGFEPRE